MTHIKNSTWYLVSLIIICIIGFYSCQKDSVEAPDVSDIQVSLDIDRTEDAIAELDTNQILEGLAQLFEQDSSFYSIYFNHILGVPLYRLNDEQKISFMKGFINDARIQRIHFEVDSVFGDFIDIVVRKFLILHR